MTLIYHIIRTLLGLILICATAITFGFLPMPDQSLFSTEGYALIQAIIDTGYLWQTIGVACAFVGIFYVINRFVTLATMVLIPISINVVLFQIFLQPNPLTVSAAPAYIFLACNLFILWINKDDFVYIAAG